MHAGTESLDHAHRAGLAQIGLVDDLVDGFVEIGQVRVGIGDQPVEDRISELFRICNLESPPFARRHSQASMPRCHQFESHGFNLTRLVALWGGVRQQTAERGGSVGSCLEQGLPDVLVLEDARGHEEHR